MFRTRDFVLLFTCIAFLVAAIGGTVVSRWLDPTPDTTIVDGPVASTSPLILSATAPEAETASRVENLNRLREQIAQIDLASETESDTVAAEPAFVPTTTNATATESAASEELLACSDAQPYRGFWDPRDLVVEEREGAIVVERSIGTSTTVVLQLPSRSAPAATPSCIDSDVVGVATDGSLIRNDEQSVYQLFGAETLLGYALDGFPIYGVGTTRTDVCGGRIGPAGAYRYELALARDTIINCFSALPVELP